MATKLERQPLQTTEAPRPEAPPVRTARSSAVRRVQRYAELTGLPFLCLDATTGDLLAESGPELIPWIPEEVRRELQDRRRAHVVQRDSGLTFYGFRVERPRRPPLLAVGYVLSDPAARPPELVLAAAEENWSQERLDAWLARQEPCSPEFIHRLLSLAVQQVGQESESLALLSDIEQLSNEIEITYEEISLLHMLTQHLQISRSPLELAELCLNRLHAVVDAGVNAIWIEKKNGSPQCLVRGTMPLDEDRVGALIERIKDEDFSRPLVRNRLPDGPLADEFPELRNLVVVPISEGIYRSGWIVSCNLTDGREFGTVEASLISSVATILGTHVRNIDLYEQHQELLLSFVRSLVSTLDAKDPYTRGHSERVALIARRLGEEMGLRPEELHNIYVSGLLHDIGKIGVDDRILRKSGKLTDEEFDEIKKHPVIGYQILRELTNLSEVLPGVRSHHETYSGRGYPDGLAGEEIPMMARVLAVADGYDAMNSNRTYRQGLPVEKIEEIFQRGAGDQWDARVIDAYFRARGEIRRICETYTPTNGNLLVNAPNEPASAAE